MSDLSPLQPRCLTRQQAAEYVGVSVDVFDLEVRDGLWPAGRRRGARGGKTTWDRKALDAAEDIRSGFSVPGAVAESYRATAADAWETQLRAEIAAKRAKGSPKDAR